MSGTKDNLMRQLNLLRLIPEQPRSTNAAVLQEKLQDRGFQVTLRSVQRDLVRLSLTFQLITEKRNGRNEWSFIKGSSIDLRDMEPPTALALTLAEEHLQNLLPQSVMYLMAPHFRKARECMSGMQKNQLSHWSRSVRAVPNGKSLIPAPIDDAVWEIVSSALLKRKQMQVKYLGRGKAHASEFVLHVAGIVSRHATSYAIASVNNYHDLRQFAIHRIQSAQLLDDDAKDHPQFDIDDYIQTELNASETIQSVNLVADVSENIAWILKETPLAPNQQLTPLPDRAWFRLEATVPGDSETLWWVFSLGENICVHQPTAWREEMIQRAEAMRQLYD